MTILHLLFLLVLVLSFAAVGRVQGLDDDGITLWEALQAREDLSVFANFVETYLPSLIDEILLNTTTEPDNQYTLFVPTNEAFGRLDLNDTDFQDVLLVNGDVDDDYQAHRLCLVGSHMVSSRAIVPEDTLSWFGQGLETWYHQSHGWRITNLLLQEGLDDPTTLNLHVTHEEAAILREQIIPVVDDGTTPMLVSNGVIHTLDDVILPPCVTTTITDSIVISPNTFSTVLEWLWATDVFNYLDSNSTEYEEERPPMLTAFLPNDASLLPCLPDKDYIDWVDYWMTERGETWPPDGITYADMVLYLLVPGLVMDRDGSYETGYYPTLSGNGSSLFLNSSSASGLYVNGYPVSFSDSLRKDGVIHDVSDLNEDGQPMLPMLPLGAMGLLEQQPTLFSDMTDALAKGTAATYESASSIITVLAPTNDVIQQTTFPFPATVAYEDHVAFCLVSGVLPYLAMTGESRLDAVVLTGNAQILEPKDIVGYGPSYFHTIDRVFIPDSANHTLDELLSSNNPSLTKVRSILSNRMLIASMDLVSSENLDGLTLWSPPDDDESWDLFLAFLDEAEAASTDDEPVVVYVNAIMASLVTWGNEVFLRNTDTIQSVMSNQSLVNLWGDSITLGTSIEEESPLLVRPQRYNGNLVNGQLVARNGIINLMDSIPFPSSVVETLFQLESTEITLLARMITLVSDLYDELTYDTANPFLETNLQPHTFFLPISIRPVFASVWETIEMYTTEPGFERHIRLFVESHVARGYYSSENFVSQDDLNSMTTVTMLDGSSYEIQVERDDGGNRAFACASSFCLNLFREISAWDGLAHTIYNWIGPVTEILFSSASDVMNAEEDLSIVAEFYEKAFDISQLEEATLGFLPDDPLVDLGPLSIFAPVNDSFVDFIDLLDGVNDRFESSIMLLYHLARGVHFVDEELAGSGSNSLELVPWSSVYDLASDIGNLTIRKISVDGEDTYFANDAKILSQHLYSRGVIYKIDRHLITPAQRATLLASKAPTMTPVAAPSSDAANRTIRTIWILFLTGSLVFVTWRL